MKKIIAALLCSSVLLACSGPGTPPKNTPKTCIVKRASVHKTLYFTGTLQPLHESTLTSPVDAVIESMAYHYGESVKKDAVVFTLNSAELQRQYNETITEYLKSKDSFTIAKAKFTGTKDLWSAGLISKNNYLSEKSNLNTARVTLMQTTRKLSEMLEKMGAGDDDSLSSLSFEAFDKVRLALTSQHNLIRLPAPHAGILLYPPKTADSTAGHMTIGSAIKAGEVLALIGDLSGVSVNIDVPEVDITHIKEGMPAVIHGVAFGQETLHGALVSINAQASSSSSGALPSFTAIIEVKSLTKAQQSLLKVGMSAAVELQVDSSDKLQIPIAAIQQKQGKSMVQRRDPKGIFRLHPIVTGPALGDNVVVESGLKAGEVILCP
ncbi:MAG TPA: hypothetical protein DDY37_00675 [Legionella sp.]|nr:hypothetical protein [Legionella sp.]